MNTGRPLQDIAKELQRQASSRVDYLPHQGQIRTEVLDKDIVLSGINGKPFKIRPHAHGQFADHLGIPTKYYNRMRAEQPQLLATNMNTWLDAEPNEKRMVRTLDGDVRAFLSSRYRPLDNFDLATVVLPKLQDLKAEVMSAELTETRFYVKAILPTLSDAPPPGGNWGVGHQSTGKDRALIAALTISNSDVGAGTLRVEPGIYDTGCTNLSLSLLAAMRKYHIGRAFDADASNFELYKDETRAADDKAFWLKVRDIVDVAFDEDLFKAAIAQAHDKALVPIVSKELPKVVEVMVKRLALPESLGGNILTHLAAGGELNQWGLSRAVTATANDRDDYELSTELERAGGKVLALVGRDWDVISNARASAAA